MAFEMKGASGRIAWAYATAADLGPWVMRRDKAKHLQVRATVVAVDAYAVTQPGLVLVTPAGRWPIEGITVENGVLQGRLGQRER